MKKYIILFAVLAILIAGATIALIIHSFDVADVEMQEDITTTLSWSQMDPLPDSATNIHVRSHGSRMTQEYYVIFDATPEDIENWIANSLGTQGITPVQDDTLMTYKLNPPEAQFAAIVINKNTHEVIIHVYWS